MHADDREGEGIWQRLLERVRGGESLPFEKHWVAFLEASKRRASADGPLPAWRPDPDTIGHSNLGRLMRDRGAADYEALRRWSLDDPEGFWREASDRVGVVWAREPETMLDASGGAENPVWAPGARLNIVESCFNGPGDAPAIVSGREGSESIDVLTFAKLERLSERVAAGFLRMGCRTGDAVALYMPMTSECVAAYLGILRAGCVVISIADSFSSAELRKRIEIGNAVAIVTVERITRAGKTIAILDKVREAEAPPAIVIGLDASTPRATQRAGDLRWEEFLGADEPLPAVAADPQATINVLFSSGTTGTPKAIPWTHLTPLKCAVDGHLHQDIRPGDVVAWPTNIGWMMGPWLVFASLINGATIAIFEGAPSGTEFVRFVERSGVTVLGTVPSLVRAWRALDGDWPADWNQVRVFSSTGEPSSREDYLWLMSRSRYLAPVIEYCGGTEVGGAYISGTVVQSASPATFTTPALSLDLAILDDRGRPVTEGEEGEVFLIPPSIGLSQRLLNRDHHQAYYAGVPTGPDRRVLRRHGDRMTRLARGFYLAQGRADDTMNLGGIKVGSLEIERVLEGHEVVRSCAAIGVQPDGEGAERLVVHVVPEDVVLSSEPNDARRTRLKRELDARLARELNPLFRLHDLVITESLPTTATNKLMRRQLKESYVEQQRSGRLHEESIR